MTSKRVLITFLSSLFFIVITAINCGKTTTSPILSIIDVESSWPENGSAGVDVDVRLAVAFNAPMDKAATESSFSINPAISGTFSWSSDSTTMSFTPTSSLYHGTSYMCKVSEAAHDADGSSSVTPFEFSFTTGLSEDTNIWLGNHDFVITGTTLAKDNNANGNVDTIRSIASFSIDESSIPSDAVLLQAFLFWGGSQIEGQGADQAITMGFPDGSSVGIGADALFHDDANSIAYDIDICKKDITWDILSRLSDFAGVYGISDYSGKISDDSSDNASAAILIIYGSNTVANHTVCLNNTLYRMSSNTQDISFTGLMVASSAMGRIGYYTLEGDIGGTGTEQAQVEALPGAKSILLSDVINPVGNPMNRTINTVIPTLTDAVGVDIDCFGLSDSLSPNDETINVAYSAGTDAWWHVFTVISAETNP